MRRLLGVQLLLLFIYQPILSCPRGMMPLAAGRCIGLTAAMEGSEARLECTRMGGNLTSIMSNQHNEQIRLYLAKNNVQYATIGLTTMAWKWIDGNNLNFTKFSDPWTNVTMYYWIMYYGNGLWYLSKSGKWPGICQLPPRNEAACGTYEFVKGDINCLKFQQGGATWNEAEEVCVKGGAHLAAIHSKEMDNYIARRAQELSHTSGVHIGLRTNSSVRQMAWTDGSRVQYANFGKGFPQDVFGHCTALETSAALGKWVSNQCASSHLPFACTRPALDPRKPMAPATCPEPLYYTKPTVIYSPSYPGPPGAVRCDYFFVVNERQRVKITIEEFSVNTCCDKLELYNGAFEMTPYVTLTGQIDDPVVYTTPQSNVMKLSLTTEDGRNVNGFRIRFDGAA